MTEIKLAIVGSGVMGSNHARVVSGFNECSIKYIIDKDRFLGEKLANKVGAKWLNELCEPEDIDALIIASPTEIHFQQASKFFPSDVAVFIEKPISTNITEISQLVENAQGTGQVLMCGFVERFNPAFRTAQLFIEEPFHVIASRHSPYTPRIRTGVAWDLMIHDVDLLTQIMGNQIENIVSVSQRVKQESPHESEDVAEATILFKQGAIGQVSASRVGHKKIRSIMSYQIDKLVEIDLLRRDITIFHNVNESAGDLDGRGYKQEAIIEIPEMQFTEEPLTAQFKHFLKLIRREYSREEELKSLIPAHSILNSAFTKNLRLQS